MATKLPTSRAKRERSIPVKVSIDSRPAPTSLPPVPEAHLRPVQKTVKRASKEKFTPGLPKQKVPQPVHEWPEERRRKLMWWLVGGGMTVIVIGWLAVVRLEMSGGHSQNLFTEARNLLANFHLPGEKKSTAGEQEIRNLDNQVFPQFNQ